MLLAACISLSSFALHIGHSNTLSFNSNFTLLPHLGQYLVVGNHLSNITTLSFILSLFFILPNIECCCKKHLRYHIIFVTKYRRKCLDEIKQYVFDAFRYVESKSHIKIHNMNLYKDHIHLLISFPPDYSISQTVNRLKQMTTNYLYRIKEIEEYLRKFYWKKKRLLWTHGYFVSTIGHISEDIVFEYINNQGKDYYIN